MTQIFGERRDERAFFAGIHQGEATLYLDTFADLPEFEPEALEIVERGLDPGVPPRNIARTAGCSTTQRRRFRMRMLCVTPSLFTPDLEGTVEFYTRLLGFTVDTLWPREAPTLAILDHGPVHLLFSTDRRDASAEPAMSGDLRFDVEGVGELYERIAPEVEVLWGPDVYRYGRREFSIVDPNGYALIFSEPTDDPVTRPG